MSLLIIIVVSCLILIINSIIITVIIGYHAACETCRLPELQELKGKLQNDCDNRFSAVFMTGSGSTMVGVGSSKAPLWMQERIVYQDMFCSPAKLISRQPGKWYQPTRKPSPLVAA